MKNYRIFILIMLTVGLHHITHGMMQIPTAQTQAAFRGSDLAKYMPGFMKAKSVQVELPKVQLSKQQIDSMMADIVDKTQVKRAYGFGQARGGIFRSTPMRLMTPQWNYAESPYRVLDISETASLDDLKKAYKQAAMKYHPDRGGSAEKFRKVKEAFEYLQSLIKMGQTHSYAQQQSQQQQKTQGYRQNTATFTPRSEVPKGNWKSVGEWKKIKVDDGMVFNNHLRSFQKSITFITFKRTLVDQDNITWIETGVLDLRFGGIWSYLVVPEMGWENYNKMKMGGLYEDFGEVKIKELLKTSNLFFKLFEKIIMSKVTKTWAPELILVFKHSFYKITEKFLENHLKLINAGQSLPAKFEPNVIINSIPVGRFEKTNQWTEKILCSMYPHLQKKIKQHFSIFCKLKHLISICAMQNDYEFYRYNNMLSLLRKSIDESLGEKEAFITILKWLMIITGYKTYKYLTKPSLVKRINDRIVKGNIEKISDEVEFIKTEIENVEKTLDLEQMQLFLIDLYKNVTDQIHTFKDSASDDKDRQKRVQALEDFAQWLETKKQEVDLQLAREQDLEKN